MQAAYGRLYGQPSYARWNRRAATHARQIASRAARLSRFRNRTRGMRFRSGQGVTSEHDVRTIYRRKRMPRFKRKRWAKKIKLHKQLNLQGAGSRTQLFNLSKTFSNDTNGNQGIASFCLYGLRSDSTDAADQPSDSTDYQDIYNIHNHEYSWVGDPTAAGGVTVPATTKIYFQSGVLDLTIRNTSQEIVSTGPTVYGDATNTLEVDIYEMICSKKFVQYDDGVTMSQWGSLQTYINECENEMRGVNNLNALDYRHRGATPFDATQFLARAGCKILKKKKYKIGWGSSITYQMRDPKNRVMQRVNMANNGGCNKPGWTRFVYVVFKAVPGYTVGSASVGDIQERISCGVTRKYMYKIPNATEKRASRYII